MKNRVPLFVVLAASGAIGVVLTPALPQARAQSPAASSPQNLQAQIGRMQSQINSLQAQVKQLQSKLRAVSPSAVVSPGYKVPDFNVPNFQVPDFQTPNFQVPSFQAPGFQTPHGQFLLPRRFYNIPDCQVTLLSQPTH